MQELVKVDGLKLLQQKRLKRALAELRQGAAGGDLETDHDSQVAKGTRMVLKSIRTKPKKWGAG